MLGVDRKHPDSHLAACSAKKAIDFSEYQYWLKSPFSLFRIRNDFIFLSIGLKKYQIFNLIQK